MMRIIMLLLASFLPHPVQPATVVYDVIERNHYYDTAGKLVFTQLIFWDFDEQRSEYLCEGYVIVSESRRYGTCRVAVTEPNRIVRGRYVRETWTNYDPEVEARRVLPIELRRNLK